MKSKIQWTFPVAMAAVLLLASITARADSYFVVLDGPSESPPNASPGTGSASITFDLVAHTFFIDLAFSGLLGTTTAAHVHSPTAVAGTGTAGVATQTPFFSNFPIGVTSGTYTNTFDTSLLSFYNPSFVTANGGTAASAEAALFAGINAGKAYLNIHTSVVPGGEIRGFLQPVPESFSTLWGALPIAGLLGFAGLRKKRLTSS
jgi:hypothetical protein